MQCISEDYTIYVSNYITYLFAVGVNRIEFDPGNVTKELENVEKNWNTPICHLKVALHYTAGVFGNFPPLRFKLC